MKQNFLEGNEAVAYAAYHAGCRFFAGYPITPATSILNTMLRILPPAGGIVLQAEDEISAAGYCIGAAAAGMKAMTATSGPGMSLCSEQISFAVGAEIPMVIVNVQRLGPSTGSATRGADGDIQSMRWGGNFGGLPIIVLAPTDVADCFVLTVQAFSLAEQYRCPVMIASNKEIGMTKEGVDLTSLSAEIASEVQKLNFCESGAESREPLFRKTSSTHGPDGYLTTDPDEIAVMLDQMRYKIESDIEQFSFYDFSFYKRDAAPDADTMILTYGVTARAARAACKMLHAEGKAVSLLILKTLWPVPEKLIREKTANIKRVIVAEMNMGQYVREIERVLRDKKVEFIGQMNGQLIPPNRIKEAFYGQPAQ
ncbi:MAG: pyruvate flavodoxin/ferredoxin oxidoreductase [Desulfobacteraceae bacterium IS3]|nr:MAG: pyruvate flavodoxin/ferredoxin oxidoreductase [Desulfobacteraceae bacterium IS3]